LSGDTDTLDTVGLYTPNNTNTNRYTVLTSLRYDLTDDQSVRIAYAYDNGRHRQTGEYGFLRADGTPEGVFGGRAGVRQVFASNGDFLRTRDRFSIALLNQVSGEYRGKFFDNKVEVLLGVRAPFFKRELNQLCYTQITTGNPICTSRALGTTPLAIVPVSPTVAGNALNYLYVVPFNTAPTGQPANAVYAPFKQTYKYEKILPNVGLTLRPVENVTVYGSYAKGLSAPRTDNLYRAPNVVLEPETTDNFDVGVRYSSARVQATFGGFLNKFKNRIVQTTETDVNSPNFGLSLDRNVGRVEIKGLEASINVRPFPWFSFNGFGSYIDAKYKDNIALSATSNLLLAGKKLVETPEWQYGYRAQVNYGPASLGANFKRVTTRFSTDLNDQAVPGYSTFDIDARISLAPYGLERTFVQVNVNNLFDTQYLGSITTQSSTVAALGGGTPTYQIGAPRSFVASIQIGF
jgi:iron complex outermembrane recepter protein